MATIDINGFSINLPAFDIDENTFQICHVDGPPLPFPLPSIDNGADPVMITIPQFYWDIVGSTLEITLTSIEDDSGCSGDITGGLLNINLGPAPDIEEPNIIPLCLDQGQTVDLTQYDDVILDGQSSCEVIWLDDEDVTRDIRDPDDYDFIDDGTTVFAVVFCDPCFSEIIEVELDINIRPEIQIDVPEIMVCGMDYELPEFDEIATITGEDDPEYYLDEDLNFGPFGPDQFLNLTDVTEIFIYDESAPNCGAIASFLVEPLIEPEIDSPSGTLSACGVITLPDPEIFNEDDWEYNTEADGSGTTFFDDDEIAETDGINMLFLIARTDEGCIDTCLLYTSPSPRDS